MADAQKILSTDKLRDGYPKINAAIDNANAALSKATTAETNATSALNTANSVQEQLEQIVIDGDSSVEAAQARVDVDTYAYSTLKARLDAEQTSFKNLVKKTDWVDPRDLPWGAVPDAYLSDGTVNPTPTDNTAKIRGAIAFAEQNGKELHLAGVFAVYGELEVVSSKIGGIRGIGSGAGYSVNALPKYKQISGFLFKGDATSQKRVRTRSLYRASASDPQDPPLSVGLNIQAEYVHLEDFTIFLDFDRTDTTTPTNYGANWDVGLFLGCRVHNNWKNVHVLGYWREAAIYVDVTRSGYFPEFKNLSNVSYERGTVDNGCDGLTMEGVYTQGGKWGLKVQGAKPKAGQTAYSDPYYDELAAAAVTDKRGNFGCSDLTAIACSFYGANHHTQYRIQDTSGNYLTDTAGGAMSIDGLAGNASGKIQGMYFASCRFSTWEAYRIKLARVNRVVFEKCHSEGGSGALTTAGSPVLYDDTDYYGPISTTTDTSNLVFKAFNATLRTAFIGSTDYTNIASAGSDINNFAKGAKFTGAVEATGSLTVGGSIFKSSGELDFRSASTADAIRFRTGSTSRAVINDLGLEFQSGITSPRITAILGELDLRGESGQGIRFRDGTTSVALIKAGTFRPSSPGNSSLGDATNTWDKVYGQNTVFTPITAASASNNSLFVDSADNKLKFKNNAGTVTIIA